MASFLVERVEVIGFVVDGPGLETIEEAVRETQD
jgi:hypothetical protein